MTEAAREDEGAGALPPDRLERAAGRSLFGQDVAGYEAGRIGYPAELYDTIATRCGGPAGRALEIGPGTGLATRDILARLDPTELVAVEADTALAAHLAASFADPRLTVVAEGFLEAPIKGCFDLACSAASFHWLEPVPALAKLGRLVRPGGHVALWWNTYRQPGADELADAITPLLTDIRLPPSEGRTGHYSLDVELHRDALTGAGFVDFEARVFRREREVSALEVRRLYESYSFVRSLPSARRESLLGDIVRLVEDKFGGRARNVVLSALYLATVPPETSAGN